MRNFADKLFIEPGNAEGVDVILPPRALTPNASADMMEEVETEITKRPGKYALATSVVLLRPVGWQAALKRAPKVKTWADARKLVQHMFSQDHESIVIIALNAEYKALAIHEAGIGGYHSVDLDVRHGVKIGALTGAAYIIIVHNHPGGNPSPSEPDLKMTEAMMEASRKAGVEVLDHVIVAYGGKAFSFAENGLLPKRHGYKSPKMPISDATLGMTTTTPGGAVLRKLWGGHGKLVVRTGLVPAAGVQKLPSIPSSTALGVIARSILGLDEVLLVACDAAWSVRGYKIVENVRGPSDVSGVLREVVGFGLAMSSSSVLIGYKPSGATTAPELWNASRWLKGVSDDAYPLVVVPDIYVISDAESFGFYDNGVL